jgi:hypothetical protein
MAGIVHGSLGWVKRAGRTGERKEVAGFCLLLPHLKPFGGLKNPLQNLNLNFSKL